MSSSSSRHGAPPVVRTGIRLVLVVVVLLAVIFGIQLLRETVGAPARPDLARDLAPSVAEGPAVGDEAEAERPPNSSRRSEDLATVPAPDAADEGEEASRSEDPDAPASQPDTVRDPEPLPTLAAGEIARVAIVVDDLGRSVEVVERLAGLGAPLTYAVLPFETHTDQVVAWLRQHGAEMICHLPMEPSGGNDPGPGALYRSMNKRELIAATRKALDRVPGALGVNNHMGSGFSAERRAMRTVLGELAARDLYYLDSRTTPDTVGFAVARRLGMRTAQRKVFLDNVREESHIRVQFRALLAEAARDGSAIGIAHPYPETVRVLATEIRRAQERGFVFVPTSALAFAAR